MIYNMNNNNHMISDEHIYSIQCLGCNKNMREKLHDEPKK